MKKRNDFDKFKKSIKDNVNPIKNARKNKKFIYNTINDLNL